MQLHEKRCIPCESGQIAPLSPTEAGQHIARLAAGWELAEGAVKLRRKFKFRNFDQSLEFVNEVGKLAEEEMHHPDLSFGWGYCLIELQTHSIKGLHENDFILAAKIDRIALPS